MDRKDLSEIGEFGCNGVKSPAYRGRMRHGRGGQVAVIMSVLISDLLANPTHGSQISTCDLVRLAPNGTNPGPFQVRFQCI